jgi:hypothetical protein
MSAASSPPPASDRGDDAAATPRPRDVIDVLAAMPPDDLRALRARTERRLAQAQADVGQVGA